MGRGFEEKGLRSRINEWCKKTDIKIKLIIVIIEAILALIVGYILFWAEKDSIEKKTVETLSEYFEAVDEEMTYDQVMKILYEDSQEKSGLIATLTQENAILQKELSALNERISQEEINSKLLEQVQTFADLEDYENAISILGNVVNKTFQMEQCMEMYKSQYEMQIAEKVDNLLDGSNYDEAKNLIKKAEIYIPGSSVLKDLMSKVQKSMPQYLVNIEQPYEKYGYTEVITGSYMQMAGMAYYNGFQLGVSFENSYSIYNLNDKYTRLSGIIGHIDNSGDSSETVIIYADGIVIKTIEVNWQNLPIEFEIDVTGVKQLKFERTPGYTQTGIANVLIK